MLKSSFFNSYWKKGWIFFLFSIIVLKSEGQQNRVSIVSCSELREIFHLVFADSVSFLTDGQIGQTVHGSQVRPYWSFTTTKFQSKIKWEGAAHSLLEFHTDRRDSFYLEQWQFVFEFPESADSSSLLLQHKRINESLKLCGYPSEENGFSHLKPAIPGVHEVEISNLMTRAEVFYLPIKNSTAPERRITILNGIEKTKKGQRILLLVESQKIMNEPEKLPALK